RVRGSFTNADFTANQAIKEVGIFAKVGAEHPVLLGYVNDGQGEIIPPGNSGNIVSRVRDLYLGITGEAQVVITIDKSLVYVTVEDLEDDLGMLETELKAQIQEIREYLSNSTFGKSSLSADYTGDFYLGK
ncbi:MAG: hypothetical protein ACRC6A_08615, partial [Fusobacteriaceae bacterium]